MLRHVLLSLCALCVCVAVANADGASVGKVRDLFPNEHENADADGVATLVWIPDKDNPDLGKLEVSVVITGFKPNTTYVVRFAPSLVGGSILTNPAGNGSWKYTKPRCTQ